MTRWSRWLQRLVRLGRLYGCLGVARAFQVTRIKVECRQRDHGPVITGATDPATLTSLGFIA